MLQKKEKKNFVALILQKEHQEVSQDRESVEERARMIRARYMDGRTMSGRDRRLLTQLEGEERTLIRRERHLQAANLSWLNKCLKCCRPFEMVFGIFYLLLGVLIFVSLFLTWYVSDSKYFNSSRAIHSRRNTKSSWGLLL